MPLPATHCSRARNADVPDDMLPPAENCNMMAEQHNPYSRFETAELILRDELAIDRTLLANERTLLAYLRSGVALLIAGVSIIHFSQQVWFTVVGYACIPSGIVTAAVGLLRYRRMDAAISTVRRTLRNESALQVAADLSGQAMGNRD